MVTDGIAEPDPDGRDIDGALVDKLAFAQLDLRRLYLHHAVDNPGSCPVARSARFVHEGTLRESFRYADGTYRDEHIRGLLAVDVTAADLSQVGSRRKDG